MHQDFPCVQRRAVVSVFLSLIYANLFLGITTTYPILRNFKFLSGEEFIMVYIFFITPINELPEIIES